MALPNSKIFKVAGLSLLGFCAVSIGVDKASVGPMTSQIAGFCGALAGGWVGSRRRRRLALSAEQKESGEMKAAEKTGVSEQ